jgi:hypothetical protein
MDTDGPCALPEITAAATRRDQSARLASTPLARTAPSLDAFRFGVRSPITLRTLFNDHDTDIGL